MSKPGAPVLEARGLTKRFGRVVALDHADFDLQVESAGDNARF